MYNFGSSGIWRKCGHSTLGSGTGKFEALTPAEHVTLAGPASETMAGNPLIVATVPGKLGEPKVLIAGYEELGIKVVLASRH